MFEGIFIFSILVSNPLSMHKLKYLLAFIVPITVYISFTSKGIWTFSPLIFAFVCVPIFELFFKADQSNFNALKTSKAKNDKFYAALLYITVPTQLFFCYLFFQVIQEPLTTIELAGRISGFGVLCGIFGINVGHELSHRTNKFEHFLGEFLLFTSLESHFGTYHNSGHHYNVATRKDPATARKNEPVYIFWFRSHFGSYIQAWKIQSSILKKRGDSFFSLKNKMLLHLFFQIVFFAGIYYFFGGKILLYFVIAAHTGILLLETVNYIEHYGLVRKTKENGKLERVLPKHSWNSNHVIGRTLLFELSRHSDHHYKASKPYQILEHVPNSPQMITGYPGMMLLALFPPIWFRLMHRRLTEFEHKNQH